MGDQGKHQGVYGFETHSTLKEFVLKSVFC